MRNSKKVWLKITVAGLSLAAAILLAYLSKRLGVPELLFVSGWLTCGAIHSTRAVDRLLKREEN